MATGGSLLSEEKFTCSICLELFTKPVSTPCGHNFCSDCIHQYWDLEDICQCPLCKRLFVSRPELHVNTMVAELVEEVRRSAEEKASCQSRISTETDGIPCDFCMEVKEKAVKSCLVCLTSFCQLHLEPHQRVAALRSHTLIEPVGNLDDRMCKKHGKINELYCRGERAFICVLCLRDDHRDHDVVTFEEEFKALTETKDRAIAEMREMIESRSLKMTEMVASIRSSQRKLDKAKDASQKVFTDLLDSIQKIQRELFEMMDEQHRGAKGAADGFLNELQEERSELETQVAKLEQLSQCEDHLHFILNFPALSSIPAHRDWEQIQVRSSLCPNTLTRAMSDMMESVKKAMEENPVIRSLRKKQNQKSADFQKDTSQLLTELSDHTEDLLKELAGLLRTEKCRSQWKKK